MFRSSGIGTYIRNLLKAIKESGQFSLTVIANRSECASDLELASYDLIKTSSPIYTIKEQVEMPFKIPSCDLFWSPHFNVPLLPIRAQKRVVTIHDMFCFSQSSLLTPLQKMYAKVVISRAVHSSDLVITVSEFSKREICKYIKVAQEKIHTIYLGVDHDVFSNKVERPSIRKKYHLYGKFLLFVGNIKPHKNVKGLIEAYKTWLGNKGKEYHLVIIGKSFKDFPLSKEIDQDSVLKDVVHFLHDVDDHELPWFYQNASVTLMPSFYEGFGLPPLEAMSAGCPVIVSRVASLPEICQDSALYIDPYQPATILKALDDLLYGPRHIEDIVRKGKRHVSAFEWEATATRHIELFNQMMQNTIFRK